MAAKRTQKSGSKSKSIARKAPAKKAPAKKPVLKKKAAPKKPAPKKAAKKPAPKKAAKKAAKKLAPKKAAKKPAPKKAAPKPQKTSVKPAKASRESAAKKTAPAVVSPKRPLKDAAPARKPTAQAKPSLLVSAQPSGKPAAPPTKAALLKAAQAAAKLPKPLTKPPKLRPGQAPPKPSPKNEATVVRTKSGEQLTLLPARSAGLASRPSQPGITPAKSQPGKKDSPRPGQKALLTLTRTASDRPPAGFVQISMPIPVRKQPPTLTLEDRFKRLDEKVEGKDDEFKALFYKLYDQAWVSHDSALEGTVYTREEIEAGFVKEPALIDSNLQPAVDEIRRHREAIDYVRDFGLRKKLPVTVDVIRKLYLILHPSEGDLKTVKYRKDIPQHRLYFHEYAAPDKIAYKVRLVVDWLNEPETRRTRNAVRIAARAHYDLLRVFPFPVDSGKVARLFMNLLLYRAGYPPAIVHAKERQAYYEALKGEPNKILRIVTDAVEDGLSSIEKFFEEQDARKRIGG